MKFITLVSVTLFVICGTFSSAVAADWISVYSQGGVDYYYDRESITYDNNGKIKVDTKTFFEYDAVKAKIYQGKARRGIAY